MYKYKNISGKDLSLGGYGLIKKDGIVEVKKPINNVNFKPVKEAQKTGDQSPTNNKLS